MVRVLIVDDSESMTALVAAFMEDLGWTYEVASDGLEGLQKMHHNRPDVVLSDVQMDVLDGIAMGNRMRESPELESIPLIIMSTLAEYAEEAMNIRGAFFWLKEGDPAALYRLLKLIFPDEPISV